MVNLLVLDALPWPVRAPDGGWADGEDTWKNPGMTLSAYGRCTDWSFAYRTELLGEIENFVYQSFRFVSVRSFRGQGAPKDGVRCACYRRRDGRHIDQQSFT